MSAAFQFTPQATEDLDSIWWFIKEGSVEAADQVEAEIIATCARLAAYPSIGHKRPDITSLPVLFWTIPKFPNYVVVYRPQTQPLQIIAILHSKLDVETKLVDRLPSDLRG
jgi:plasmid stabilization system protein ParE